MTSIQAKQRPTVGRSRSWRTEKRLKSVNSPKFNQENRRDFDPTAPTSVSAKTSPKRAISPEVFNWRSGAGKLQDRSQPQFQILIAPKLTKISPESSDLSSSFVPQPWNLGYLGESNYLWHNEGKQTGSSYDSPLPLSSSTPSEQTSNAGSVGARTPSWSEPQKVLTIAQQLPVPDPQTPSGGPPTRSDSVLTVIRGAFNKWLDSLRGSGAGGRQSINGSSSGRPRTGQTEIERRTLQGWPTAKCRQEVPDCAELTLSTNSTVRFLRPPQWLRPGIPAHDHVHRLPAAFQSAPQEDPSIAAKQAEAARNADVPQSEAKPLRHTPQRPTQLVLATGLSISHSSENAKQEAERLALAVTMATFREAEIEASERQRRQRDTCRWNGVGALRLSSQTPTPDHGEPSLQHTHSPIKDGDQKADAAITNVRCAQDQRKLELAREIDVDCSVCATTIGTFSDDNFVCCCNHAPGSQPKEPSSKTILSICFNETAGQLNYNWDDTCYPGVPTDHRDQMPCLHTCYPRQTLSACQRTCTLPMINRTFDRWNHQGGLQAQKGLTSASSCPALSDPAATSVGTLSRAASHETSLSDSRCEFNISFSDIKLTQCIMRGRRKAIHKGQWHGNIVVHIFYHLNRKERIKFWRDVSRLKMTRHENIALFMGACMEPPVFAIVTSACKGISLHEKLHDNHREKLRRSFPLAVVKQLSQAISYLHNRGVPIIVQHLTSHNIFLQPKVVLCLTDFSSTICDYRSSNLVAVPAKCIKYVAPELLKTYPKYGDGAYSPHLNRPQEPSTSASEEGGDEAQLAELRSRGSHTGNSTTVMESSTSPVGLEYLTGDWDLCTQRKLSHRSLLSSGSEGYDDIFEDAKALSTLSSASNESDYDDRESERRRLPEGCLLTPKRHQTAEQFYYLQEDLFTKATDIFAFGTIIFELHTRKYPFDQLDVSSYLHRLFSGTRDSAPGCYFIQPLKNAVGATECLTVYPGGDDWVPLRCGMHGSRTCQYALIPTNPIPTSRTTSP